MLEELAQLERRERLPAYLEAALRGRWHEASVRIVLEPDARGPTTRMSRTKRPRRDA